MSRVTRVIATVTFAVLVALTATLLTTRSANAQIPRAATCTEEKNDASSTKTWMDKQINDGKLSFVARGNVLCAW